MVRESLSNAVRHARGPITVGSRVRGRDVELFVRDRGPGVPDELKDAIFERFHRVDESRSAGGAGLGLSIASQIAGAHGGTIEADSRVGKGSTFTLRLPPAKREAPGQERER